MLINYFAAQQSSPFTTTPDKLNDYLNGTPQGYIGGSVNGTEVAKYATQNGVNMSYAGKRDGRDDLTLDSYICNGLPVILDVSKPKRPHFVVATGQTTINSVPTYSINDPGFSQSSLQGYGYTYGGMRLYQAGSLTPSALYVVAHSPVELLAQDPAGNRTGFEASSKAVLQQIPDSSYGAESIADDLDPANSDPTPVVKNLEILEPADGTYILSIVGTGSGPYTIDFLGYDSAGTLSTKTIEGTASPGVTTTLLVKYASAPGSVLQVISPTTATSIRSSAEDFNEGQKITFTATVKASAGTPTGTVVFWDSQYSEVVIGRASLVNGVAKIKVSLPTVPDRQYVKAVYLGDGTFEGSESGYIPEFSNN
jgi:hypothetical protein